MTLTTGGIDVSMRGGALLLAALACACGGTAPAPEQQPRVVTVDAPTDEQTDAKTPPPPDRDVTGAPPEADPALDPEPTPERTPSSPPIVCGGVTCGAGMPGLLSACCTPGGACGISFPAGRKSCFQLNAPGRLEPACAPAGGAPGLKGCCSPQGVCGVMFGAAMPIALGCFTGIPVPTGGARSCTP